MIEIVKATREHAEFIAANPRPADVAEAWTQDRTTPLDVMLRGIRYSPNAQTGMVDGEPIGMFGVSPMSLIRGIGVPWMMASARADILQARKALLRESRDVVGAWREQYKFLANVVDDRNVRAKQWLEWLGFEIGETYHLGPDQMPFRMFTWSRKNV